MIDCSREVTKEEYEAVKAVNKTGYVPSEMKEKYFNEGQLYGYGVYGAQMIYSERDDKYYLVWSQGSSCD